jgi:hypothetical protein
MGGGGGGGGGVFFFGGGGEVCVEGLVQIALAP